MQVKKKDMLVRITLLFSRSTFNIFSKHLRSILAIEKILTITNMKVKLLKEKLDKNVANKKKKKKTKTIFRVEIIAKHTCKNIKCTNHYKSDICYANLEKHWHYRINSNDLNQWVFDCVYRRTRSSKFTNTIKRNCEKQSLHNIAKSNSFNEKSKSLESITTTSHSLSTSMKETKFLFDKMLDMKTLNMIKKFQAKNNAQETKASRKRKAKSEKQYRYIDFERKI